MAKLGKRYTAAAKAVTHGKQYAIDEAIKLVKDNAKSKFVPVLDPRLQFEFASGTRNARFRVIDNLPGTANFCPLVRRTPYLEEMRAKNLREQIAATLSRYDPNLLRRAAAYLYLKETH